MSHRSHPFICRRMAEVGLSTSANSNRSFSSDFNFIWSLHKNILKLFHVCDVRYKSSPDLRRQFDRLVLQLLQKVSFDAGPAEVQDILVR